MYTVFECDNNTVYSMAVIKPEYVVRRCDAAALARVQREGDGDGTWVELLHCNRSRVSTFERGSTCCLDLAQ